MLAPYSFENGVMVSPLYDTPAFRAELETWFEPLGLAWKWQPVTLETLSQVIRKLTERNKTTRVVAVNLCDGDEISGTPGLSVVRALERAKLPFTGADTVFYEISTSKLTMKECFAENDVPTAPYMRITNPAEDILRAARLIDYPFLIKPDVSAASYGIGLRSMVRNKGAVAAQIDYVSNGEHREFFVTNGMFAEKFIAGPEFTALVVADKSESEGLRVYPVAERVFHSALPAEEKFLSYDRYWAFYQEETPPPPGEPFYSYQMARAEIQDKLSDIARRAFRSVQGRGYGRVDMRMDAASGEIFVLEVNANCGLSSDEDSSIGRILQICEQPIHVLIEEILRDAFDRAFNSKKGRRKKPHEDMRSPAVIRRNVY